MDENNMHTSVVLKLSGEEEFEGGNTYKIDLEDMEPSKEYVIDQLFCDDDVAVYAVFEASDTSHGKYQRNLRKVSWSNFSEFRFSQRQSYTKSKNDNIWPKKPAFVNSEGEPPARMEYRRDLPNYLRHGGVGSGREDSPGPEERLKCVKLKSSSKGVNTDIDQSPKLLEEVRKAVSLNFSKFKSTELSSIFSVKSSHDLSEIKARVSSATFSLDGENGKHGKKSHPNILIVPVVIKEEEWCNLLRNEKSQQFQSCNQNLGSQTPVLLEKVSVSTTTEPSLRKNNEATQPEPPDCKLCCNEKTDETERNTTSQDYLVEEIKNLQEKFNILLKSLESMGFSVAEKKETQETIVESEKFVCINTSTCEKISVFSPKTNVVSEEEAVDEDTTNKETEEEVPQITLNVTQNSDLVGKYEKKKKILSSELFDWEEIEHHRGAQLSKSETFTRFTRSKLTYSKRSLSLNLIGETVGVKKLENIFFKLEGSFKKRKSKIDLVSEKSSAVSELNKKKLQELQKFKNVMVKPKLNNCINNVIANGFLKIQKNQLQKVFGEVKEKAPLNRINTRTANTNVDDVKDLKMTKRAGIRSRTTELGKVETKITPLQEEKQKVRSVTQRVSVKDSPQSKLHMNLLVKSHQNRELKNNNPVNCNSTRLPRASFQKKDHKIAKKEGKIDILPSPAIEALVKKNLEEKKNKNEEEDSEKTQPTTSTVVVELFSKRPNSVEDFYSEVDLQCLYSNDTDTKKDHECEKSLSSKNCQNAVVKSVWALTKVLLYEDGTKKMEVLEASLDPPDYRFNQNLTEDKVR